MTPKNMNPLFGDTKSHAKFGAFSYAINTDNDGEAIPICHQATLVIQQKHS